MWGREERTERRFLKKGTVLYHNSDTEIKEFLCYGVPESTCFFVDNRGNGKYRYQITTGVDRKVSYYGTEEVRFDLREQDEIIDMSTNKKIKVIES